MPRECVSSLSMPNQSAVYRIDGKAVHVHGCECDRQWSKVDLAKCGGLIPLHDEYLFEVELPGFAAAAHRMRDEAWWYRLPMMTSHRGQATWSSSDGEITALCNEARGEITCE